MAKLIRQKRQNKVSPIGVVKMTGLRQMGQAMGQVGQFANEVRVEATKFAEQEKINEYTDKLDYLQSRPDEEIDQIMAEQQAALEKGEPTSYYKSNSLGRLQKIGKEEDGSPIVSGQIATMDLGGWAPTYAKEWNRRANEWNAMKAGNQIASFIAKAEADQMKPDGELNPAIFQSTVNAYIDKVVANTDLRAAGAVRLSVDAKNREAYQRIHAARDAKDLELYKQQHSIVDEDLRARLLKGIKDNGSDDEGVPLLARGLLQHRLRGWQKFKLEPFQIAENVEKFIQEFQIASSVNAINKRFGSAKTGAEVEAIAEQTLNEIREAKYNQVQVDTIAVDPKTFEVTFAKTNFSDLYDTPEKQEAAIKQYIDIVKTEMDLTNNIKKLSLSAFETAYTGLLNEITIAATNQDFDLVEKKRNELFKMLQGKDEDYNEVVQKGLRSMVSATNFAYTEKDKQLAEVRNAEWNQLIPELKKYLNINQLEEYNNFFPIRDEAWQNAQKNMSPQDAARSNKARLMKIYDLLYRGKSKNKSLDKWQEAVTMGYQLDPSAAMQDQAQAYVDNIARVSMGLPDDEVWPPFKYDPISGKAESLETTRLTRAVAPQQNVPTRIADVAKSIAQSVGNPQDPNTEGLYKRKEAVVQWFRTISDDNVYTPAALRNALGDKVYNALNHASKQMAYMGDFMSSNTVLDKMTTYIQEPDKLVQITSSWKTTATKWSDIITAAPEKWGFFNDDPPLNNVHLNEITFIANSIADRDQSGKDQEEIVKEAVAKFKKNWTPSDWSLKGKGAWTRDPIDKQYSHIQNTAKGDTLNIVLREKLSKLDLRAGDGSDVLGTKINAEDLVFPNQDAASDGGVRISFAPAYKDNGAQIYRPYVRTTDNLYIPLTHNNAPIDIDLTTENSFEQKRETALNAVNAAIKQRQSIADGALSKVRNFFLLRGWNEDVIHPDIWNSVVDQLEAQQDVIDLTLERDRIQKEAFNFQSDPYQMYNKNPLQMRISDIINMAKAMEAEEAENFGALSKERQFEILSKYKLRDLKPFIEAYYNKGYEMPSYVTDGMTKEGIDATREPVGTSLEVMPTGLFD